MAMSAEEIRGLEESQQSSGGELPDLFFLTAAKGVALEHMQTSLVEGVSLERFDALQDVYADLEQHVEDGVVYAWGARPGDRAEQKWKRLKPGDIALIYGPDKQFPYWGRVYAKTRSESVARDIWGEKDGELWECMYFLDPVAPWGADCRPVVRALGYNPRFHPRGFEIPSGKVQRSIRRKHGTLVQFLASLGAESAQTSGSAPRQAPGDLRGPGEDPAVIALDGATDKETIGKYRAEQKELRGQLVGGRLTDSCALCERELPVRFLRVAHVKRRSECSDEERAQLSNLMLACTFGCDHLFELGYIYVDSAGTIRRTPGRVATPDLDVLIFPLEGRPTRAHNERSSSYFAWHRTRLVV